MPKQVIVGIKGLWTSPSRLEAPPGGLSSAGNLVITKPNIAETRNGFNSLGAGSAVTWNGGANARALFVWEDGSTVAYLVHSGTLLQYTTSGTAYTSYSNAYTATDPRMRFALARLCLYFTSTTGVFRLDAYNSTPVLSGVPKPLSITTSTGSTSAADWLTGPTSVAYRASLTFEDSKKNSYESAPSSRSVYRLASSTDTALVRVYIPTGLTTSYRLRIYRSSSTASATDEPSDEVGLIYEAALTAGNISDGYVEVEDIVPDAMRGGTGYFCPSQEGILQSNERPPVAQDICWHKQTMFYANTTSKNRVTCRLLGVSSSAVSTTKLADGDTITIDGNVFVAKDTPTTSLHFQISASAVVQVAVQDTVQDLVKKVNAYASNTTVYAYYLSGPDDGAGIFMIEERGLADSFTVTSSKAACWAPQLGTLTSSDDDANNRLYFSKPGQPEAVPLLNYLDVGSKADPILRIMALRDSLYVFKETEGIFRITGDGPFSVREHDATVRLIGKGTLAALSNELYCFSNQGVVAVSDVGVRVVSEPIQRTLEQTYLYDFARQYAHKWSIAVAHQDQNLYIISFAAVTSETGDKNTYVYCPATQAWTTWSIGTSDIGPAVMAIDSSTSCRLVLAPSSLAKIQVELRNGASTDYSDLGSAITTDISWLPIDSGAPGNMKQWTRADFLLQSNTAAATNAVTATFSNDYGTSSLTSVMAPASTTLVLSAAVPAATQMGSAFSVGLASAVADTQLRVIGLVLTYEDAADWAGG